MKTGILLPLVCFLNLMFCPSRSQAQYWIVGGQYAYEGQFPWIAEIRVNEMHWCGSSLIYPEWVVTAAHCVYDFTTETVMDTTGLRFRFNTISTYGPINPDGGVEGEAQKIYIHPQFSSNIDDFFSKGYDIALVRLKHPVTSITPIALPDLADSNVHYATGTPVKVAGWGISDTLIFTSPDTLKYCNTRIYDFALCSALYDTVTSRSFCAGFSGGEEAAGAAAGDSGGPAWLEDNMTKTLIGLVSGGSNGFTGADKPGVYTKVAAYRRWIDSIVNANGGTSVNGPQWKEEDIRIGTDAQVLKIYFGNIKAKAMDCTIYNAEGRKVYQARIGAPAFRNYTIDLNTLSKGLYILRFSDTESGQYLSRKIVKQF